MPFLNKKISILILIISLSILVTIIELDIIKIVQYINLQLLI